MNNSHLDIPVEEYFKYHPPKTEERIRKHSIANELMLNAFLKLSEPLTEIEAGEFYISLTDTIFNLVSDINCLAWCVDSIENAFAFVDRYDMTSTLMYIQQARMFLNQGITIDELRSEEKPRDPTVAFD